MGDIALMAPSIFRKCIAKASNLRLARLSKKHGSKRLLARLGEYTSDCSSLRGIGPTRMRDPSPIGARQDLNEGSRQARQRPLLPTHVRRRKYEPPSPDPLETREAHVIHDDDPRCQADLCADRVSQRGCRADRHLPVRKTLDKLPFPIRKEPVDGEFTSRWVGSARRLPVAQVGTVG